MSQNWNEVSCGNIVDKSHYDAKGLAVSEGNAGYVDAAFAYTGRLLDKATGLQNNLNRWYDASIGRWLSEDPIGFNAGDANLYRYVGNGPTNGTDPSGLDPAFAPGIGIGSGFYRPDPVLPIDGAMQEPQYLGICLAAYGAAGAAAAGAGLIGGGGAAVGGGTAVGGGAAVGGGGAAVGGGTAATLPYGGAESAAALSAMLEQAIRDGRAIGACEEATKLAKLLEGMQLHMQKIYPDLFK